MNSIKEDSQDNLNRQNLAIDDIDFDHVLENQPETFAWEPLSKEWCDKLLCNNFVIKNCLGDGNCQFRSIETALTNAGCKTDHERLRRAVCKYINALENSKFYEIVQNYRIEKQNGEFVGEWDPFKIRNKRDFTIQLRKPGFNFQGDNITLSLVSKAMNLDIILLDSDYNITDLSNTDELQPKIILLFYDKSGGHYKTIGLQSKRKKITTMFKRTELPSEIDRILDKYTYYLDHVRDICAQQFSCGRLQLNKIIADIESRTKTRISKQDKQTIMKIIRMILENENYFEQIKDTI